MKRLTDSGPNLPIADRSDLDRFGPYRVVEKIASGGMAEIYKVRDPRKPERVLALKCIRPDCDDNIEFRRMLMDEAKIASRLHHPNINRVLAVVQDDDRYGLILQHIEGLDLGRLKRFLRTQGVSVSLEAGIHVIREVLEGLDYAHNAKDDHGEYLNVVHRDVSPGNVMVDVEGRIRVVDFGIARAQHRLAKTEAGNVKGKFRYMAPEQIRGDAVGPAADVYAAAILLWELLSGSRVYEDVGVAQLMIRVANAHVPSLEEARAGVPKTLIKVFQKATSLRVEDRYASARAFAEALDGAMPEYDPERCRTELRAFLLEARSTDTRLRFNRAVARARMAAEHDLEGAILDALESPDRVERVDTRRAHPADEVPTLSAFDANEPPTMPMAIPPQIGSTPPL